MRSSVNNNAAAVAVAKVAADVADRRNSRNRIGNRFSMRKGICICQAGNI